MTTIDTVSKEQLAELLSKNWMTHDAMWFMYCLQEIGIEKTNRINRQAVRSMAGIEAKRIMKLIGLERVATFTDLKRFFSEGFEMIRPRFMKFRYSFPEKNLFLWETTHCFAYDGIKKMGVLDEYECGIMERVYGGLDATGVKFIATPDTSACLMHTTGICRREIRTDLP